MKTHTRFISIFILTINLLVVNESSIGQDYFQPSKNDPGSITISHRGNINIGTLNNTAKLTICNNITSSNLTSFRIFGNNVDSTDFAVNRNGSVRIGGILNVNQRPMLQIMSSNRPGIYLNHNSKSNYEYGLLVRIDNPTTKAFSVSDSSGNSIFLVYGSGTVHSKYIIAEKIEVRIDALTAKSWPDYVFNSDYSRLSLCDLDKYIKKYSHLPGIPSKNDIENSNIDLLELNLKLLKKIEELTLYTIELNNRIEAISYGK